MPRFYNTETGQFEELRNEAPGEHHVSVTNGRLPVLTPEGESATVPVENLDAALGEGFQILGAKQATRAAMREGALEGPLPGTQAFIEGAVNSATLGGYGALAGEEFLAGQEASPGAALAGSVVGAVGPALLTAGAGAVGAAARLTPVGALSTGAARIGTAVAGKTGSKILGATAASALEGGVAAGLDTASRQLAAGDPLDAEAIVTSGGLGLVLSGGLGGVAGLGAKGLGKILTNKSKEAIDYGKLSTELDDLNENLAARLDDEPSLTPKERTGKRKMDKSAKEIVDFVNARRGPKVAEEAAEAPPATPMDFTPDDKTIKSARSYFSWVQGSKGQAVKAAQHLGPEADEKLAVLLATDDELARLLGSKKAATPSKEQLVEALKRDPDALADILERRRNASLDLLDLEPMRVSGEVPLTARGKLRDSITDQSDDMSRSRAAQQSAFDDLVEKARASRPQSAPPAVELPPVTIADAAEFADDPRMRELINAHLKNASEVANQFGLLDSNMAKIGKAALGGAAVYADMQDGGLGPLGIIGGLAGAKSFLGGGLPALAANVIRRGAGAVVPGSGMISSGLKSLLAGAAYRQVAGAARVLRKQEVRKAVADHVVKRREAIRQGVLSLGRRVGKSAPIVAGQLLSREQAKKEIEELQRAAANRQQTQERVYESFSSLREVDLLAADKAEMATMTALDTVNSFLPKNPGFGTWGKGERWVPSDAEVYRYRQDKAILEDPTVIFPKINKGTLSVRDVEILKRAYPETYNQIRLDILDNLPALQEKLSYAERFALGNLFQVPVDSTQRPEFMQSMQMTFETEQQSKAASAGSVNNMKNPEPTAAQRMTGTGVD